MAKLTGPLFSLDARQSLADTVVYSAWKGQSYARIKVKPYNPKTAYQQGIRETVTKGVWYWRTGDYVSSGDKESWDSYAEGTGMSGFNRYLKFFVQENYDSAVGQYSFNQVPDPK